MNDICLYIIAPDIIMRRCKRDGKIIVVYKMLGISGI